MPLALPLAAVLLASSPVRSSAPQETPPADQPLARTEDGRPRVRLRPLPPRVAAPVVDGELDDEAWETAARLGPLVVVVGPRAEPTRETDVRVLCDGEALYVGFLCYDDEPVTATITQRDARLGPDDHIAIVLDPLNDRRNCYAFFLGAAGALADGTSSRNGAENDTGWDAVWQARARITPLGWQGEMRIPIASIRFDPAQTSWGFNLRRNIPRTTETLRWADPHPARKVLDPAQAGVLEGIEVLWSSLGLDVRPFVVGDLVRERDFGPTGVDTDVSTDLELGADVFYRLTSELSLALSVNTDFSETEIDQRLVNRERFQLFLPEKRDFFNEDSSAFSFGPPVLPDLVAPARERPENLPFYSRRIGLDARGAEVPLLVAAKLTGRTAERSYGVLGVRTEEEGDLDEQSLFVGRYSHNLFDKSDAGVLVTAGDPTDSGGDATYGVDVNLRTTRLFGHEGTNARLSAYVLAAENDGGDDDLAYHVGFSYPNDTVELGLEHTVLQEDYRPALGFALRSGLAKYRADAYWRPRLHESKVVRQLEFGLTPQLFTETDDGTTAIVDVALRLLGVLFESGDLFRLDLVHRRDVLEQPFQIVRGFADTTVPAGSTTATSLRATVESATKRPLSAALEVETGEYFDGDRVLLAGEVLWRPNALLTLTAGLEHDRLDLPATDVDVNVANTSLNLQLTPEHSILTLAQYDDVSEQVGLFSRYEWNPQSGHALYVVVDRAWTYSPHSLIPGDGAVTIKLGYSLRF